MYLCFQAFQAKITKFVFENHLCKFCSKFYKNISGTAIGSKFAPPYACISINYVETRILKT